MFGFVDVSPLNNVDGIITNAKTYLNIIANDIQCTAISDKWHQFVNTDFCGYDFDGLFTISLVMYLTAGFLFATICVTAVLYQYFDYPFWDLKR